ncbi:hypothetical protein XENTR_v10024680 [Xenopus tropicalis]|uniref:Ermin n=1 Tax=Xenopus tropicalis TaxID=8364 RepID=A0A8J0QM12_XENTR|nr:ermin [Xenopus tropicalis]KAE8581146.1 hypothetical protein XENTR_v10024680 [Xenopus tropicalis]|eukprot:XP_002933329.2 PREDICTED: ermin [Xenopus tropicalis]
MADETWIPEHNGDLPLEVRQVQITDIIDEMAAPAEDILCGTLGCDSGTTDPVGEQQQTQWENRGLDNKEEEAKDVEIGVENTKLGDPAEVSTSHSIEGAEEITGEPRLELESEEDNIPMGEEPGDTEFAERCSSPLSQQPETPDLLPTEKAEKLSACQMIEVEEEELASTGHSKENGKESFYDEQENGSKYFLSLSPTGSQQDPSEGPPNSANRPDIFRHSYSRYDTVSYRKIRKGNTKQRIDEFESMMNL